MSNKFPYIFILTFLSDALKMHLNKVQWMDSNHIDVLISNTVQGIHESITIIIKTKYMFSLRMLENLCFSP